MRDIRGILFDLDQTLIDSKCSLNYRLARNWRRVYSLIPQFVVYDGLQNLLRNISKSDIKIIVVTSAPASYCNKVLSFHEFPYNGSVCYHDTNHHKPHPEPMDLALHKFGFAPTEVVSVGDEVKDILSSRAAGIFSIAAAWETQGYEDLLSSPWEYFCKTTYDLDIFLSNV